jgi:signal peptidase I
MSVMSEKRTKEKGGFGETVRVVIHALILALIVRTFLFQPFNIPSGSMMETLLVGDYLFVSKYSYGYSRYSFPFGPPLFEGRVWDGTPERGDVVVFKLPVDNETDYIKRVIGLPGDTVQVRDSIVYVNDEPIGRERVDDFVAVNHLGAERRVARYVETMDNGRSYSVLQLTDSGFGDNTQVYHVPEGHYFMMGDNRDNSTDSRMLGAVGYVPHENLVGRAEVIFFSLEEGAQAWQFWRWPTGVRWDRLFSMVR